MGESHTFEDSDYWAEWLDRGNGYKLGNGHLQRRAGGGRRGADARRPLPGAVASRRPVYPLDLEGVPAAARPGEPVTVTVVEYFSATGAAGEGARRTVAGRHGDRRRHERHDGRGRQGDAHLRPVRRRHAEGDQGARRAVGGRGRPRERRRPAGRPPPVATVDNTAARRPRSRASRPASASRARRRRGRCAARVTPDPAGLRAVKLSLTRSSGGRCQLYSPSQGALPATRAAASA